ncbi:hypothetical protein I79_023471 [Cricetulus griseus]|uniref:Uncharacterized protein n=1 Tax=Cricetulus griseus TaxID=10029 RepID=G3II10_CRIGR|nr:hypothetical protein I79_023471 [Cricetulus griseus]ERE86231.1 hypothetical protein H671_2g4645 [Cricetulus griseus]
MPKGPKEESPAQGLFALLLSQCGAMPLGLVLTQRYGHLKKLCGLVSTSESLRLAGPTEQNRLRCKEHSTWTIPVDVTVADSSGGGTKDTYSVAYALPAFVGASGGLILPTMDHMALPKLSSALVLGQQVLNVCVCGVGVKEALCSKGNRCTQKRVGSGFAAPDRKS